MKEKPVARVVRKFNVAPQKIFDAFLDPEMIRRWMFGPHLREESVVHIRVEPHPGGLFSFLVKRQGKEIDHVGEYLEIERPGHLVFTWAVKEDLPVVSKVIVGIVSFGRGSELVLIHELPPSAADYRARTEEAWGKMLDALAEILQ